MFLRDDKFLNNLVQILSTYYCAIRNVYLKYNMMKAYVIIKI